MSTSDVHRSGTADVTSSEHAPLWAVGLSILLIALGFAGRRSGNASTATGDRKPLEAGRGRSAETPSQIPVRGWKDILLRVYHGISENRILLVAAGVTFYSLLAIFPGIAALISIYGLFADPATVASHLDTIAGVAPSGAIDVLREQMTRLASQGGTTLGVSFLSVWQFRCGPLIQASKLSSMRSTLFMEKRKGAVLSNLTPLRCLSRLGSLSSSSSRLQQWSLFRWL